MRRGFFQFRLFGHHQAFLLVFPFNPFSFLFLFAGLFFLLGFQSLCLDRGNFVLNPFFFQFQIEQGGLFFQIGHFGKQVVADRRRNVFVKTAGGFRSEELSGYRRHRCRWRIRNGFYCRASPSIIMLRPSLPAGAFWAGAVSFSTAMEICSEELSSVLPSIGMTSVATLSVGWDGERRPSPPAAIRHPSVRRTGKFLPVRMSPSSAGRQRNGIVVFQ